MHSHHHGLLHDPGSRGSISLMTNPTITTEAYGEISETVLMDGTPIGDVFGTCALPAGARHGTYRFASRQAAIDACVSYALTGTWSGER